MLKTNSFGIKSDGAGARAVIFRNDSSIPPYVIVENKDLALAVSIEYQESDDGVTWTVITGTSAAINAGLSNGQIVQSSRRLLALFSLGAVDLDVHVIKNQNFNGETPITLD